MNIDRFEIMVILNVIGNLSFLKPGYCMGKTVLVDTESQVIKTVPAHVFYPVFR